MPRTYTINGERKTFSELMKHSCVPYKTLYARLNTHNWKPEIAISTPLTTSRAYKKILKKHGIS